jgi:hypothetical protein
MREMDSPHSSIIRSANMRGSLLLVYCTSTVESCYSPWRVGRGCGGVGKAAR